MSTETILLLAFVFYNLGILLMWVRIIRMKKDMEEISKKVNKIRYTLNNHIEQTKLVITEAWLEANGWQRSTFFYQIGSLEEENDREIWQKDGIALAYDYTREAWLKAKSYDLNYIDGFPEDDIILFTDQI